MRLEAERITFSGYVDWLEEAYRRRWSDGLPVVPPTEDLVRAMLAAVDRDPQEVVGEIPPRYGIATVEKLAINSVMGGCKPEYFPVVLAAVEAMLAPEFNLNGVQVTTHCGEPLVILSGPIVDELEINTGHAVFGNGARANGTIGRAIKLILWNLGGSYPGEPDKTTFAHPGKWSFCIGEAREANPWLPIHVERGLPGDADAVTVISCEGPQSILCRGTAEHILNALVDAMAHPGSNNFVYQGQTLLVVNPENAAILAKAGHTKQSLREHLWRHARVPLRILKRGAWTDDYVRVAWRDDLKALQNEPEALIPPTWRPEDIHVVVAGGAGHFCCVCPGWGALGGLAVTRPVQRPEARA
ncbi:MAG: hypothetical protein HY691_20045 [Chloroflexi bacterium]|nr:hypothetical protein [Chloroflexota bacterium]